ncbi:hypothetical protein L6452_40643 [Arctium lappa]|uniref:Uncharacterized protein n=1 Tax=Arctium lappa TaxID=4217 RepID=A0ACB8XP71_ARCLA|nr:hypothetical protein L6452_40643 [Arctium lappa]
MLPLDKNKSSNVTSFCKIFPAFVWTPKSKSKAEKQIEEQRFGKLIDGEAEMEKSNNNCVFWFVWQEQRRWRDGKSNNNRQSCVLIEEQRWEEQQQSCVLVRMARTTKMEKR